MTLYHGRHGLSRYPLIQRLRLGCQISGIRARHIASLAPDRPRVREAIDLPIGVSGRVRLEYVLS